MIDQYQAQEARDQMLKFVEELHSFLGQTANKPFDYQGKPLILEEMVPALKDAWAHFDGDFSLDKAKFAIYEAPQDRIESHGLYGPQLGAKLSLVQLRLRRFLDGVTKKALLKLIDALDTVLDSIIAATGLDGAIKEMKDLLRNSVDDE
jgi:hypothetical protein